MAGVAGKPTVLGVQVNCVLVLRVLTVRGPLPVLLACASVGLYVALIVWLPVALGT